MPLLILGISGIKPLLISKLLLNGYLLMSMTCEVLTCENDLKLKKQL